MSSDSKHVLIIGGGIAGKALSLFLHKAFTHPLSVRKFTSTIYEAYPKSEKIYLGGGLGLAPNGIAVLASLGLDEQVRLRGGVCRRSIFWTEGGSELARWEHNSGGQFGEAMYGMMRSTVYDILSEELDKRGLTIEFEKRVLKVEERGEKVWVEFTDGTTAEGDYLIGCDGVRSAVRTSVFPEYPKPEFIGLNGAGGFIMKNDLPAGIPLEQKEAMNFLFSKNAFFGFGGASDGGMMWWTNWVIPHEYTPEQIRDTSDIKHNALELFKDRELMFPCRELIDKTSAWVKGSILDIRSLPSWYKGRVCLIGDAAHAVSPNSGQGASLALEDTSLLALLLTRLPDPSTAYSQFEKMRRKRVEAIIDAGRRQKSNKMQVSTVGMYIRNAFMWLLFRVLNVDRIVGKAWRYRVDWEEKHLEKVVKYYRDGKLVEQ